MSTEELLVRIKNKRHEISLSREWQKLKSLQEVLDTMDQNIFSVDYIKKIFNIK